LAEKIAKNLLIYLKKKILETKLVDGISTYWNDTSKAFEIAADKTEKNSKTKYLIWKK
jgi:hypothetical protein